MDKPKYLPPKKACEILGVHFKTLYNWVDNGKIDAIRTPGGKRLYNVDKYIKENINVETKEIKKRKICYCRVSSNGQKDDLNRQMIYMMTKYPSYELIKDVGSGLNLNRKGLQHIIDYAIAGEIDEVVVAHKDRLCRFGYDMVEYIITKYSKGKIVVLEQEHLSPTEEMTVDLVSIINVFSARINGLRKYKKVIKKLR
jgi:putative resolvase